MFSSKSKKKAAVTEPGEKKNRLQARKEEKERERLAKTGQSRLINYLTQKTHFEADQVRALIEIFRRITGKNGIMDRLRFRETLHCSLGLTDDLMLDRIFSSFDGDNEGNVSESEWVLGLSVMLKGTLDEQINYCYEVFDINLDHGIGREELHSCLRGCLHPVRGIGMDELDLEEGGREIVELVMRKMDLDRDGQIKFSDFRDAVNFDPLLLQAIGECLPRTNAMMTFLSLFDTKTRGYSSFLSHPKDPAWVRESNKFDPQQAEIIRKKMTDERVFRSQSSEELHSVFKRSRSQVFNKRS